MFKYFYKIIFILLFFSGYAYAESRRNIIVNENLNSKKIGKYLEYFLDKEKNKTYEQILNDKKIKFIKSDEKILNFGYINSVIWLKFNVENITNKEKKLLLEVKNPLIDNITFFWKDSLGYFLLKNGDHTPFSKRKIKYKNPVFQFDVEPGISNYYLKIETESNTILDLNICTQESLIESIQKELILTWLYYGLLVVIAFYLLFAFISSKEKSYLFLFLFVVFYFLFRFSYSGYGFQYLYPNNIWWCDRATTFYFSLGLFNLMLFSSYFLQINRQSILLHKSIFTVLIFLFASLILSLFFPSRLIYKLFNLTGLFFGLFYVYLGILAFFKQKKAKIYYYYLISWGFFFTGGVLNSLRDLGYLPVNSLTNWSHQIGSAFHLVILSTGISYTFRIMRGEVHFAHTKLQEMYQKLDKEKELLSVTLSSIGDGVVVMNLDCQITMLNNVAEKLLDKSFHDVRGKSFDSVFNIFSENLNKKITKKITDLLNLGKISELDNSIVLILDSGIERYISFRSSPIFDEGKSVGCVFVFRDITEKTIIDKEMLKSSKLESLGTFAGGIAHDFNNILTAILGNLSLVKLNLNKNDDSFYLVSDIEEISFRAKGLTQQLLTFSKGGAPIKTISDLRKVLIDYSSFVLSGSKVDLSFNIDENLWSCEVDEGQISQAFNNLVLNAMQAMPQGGTVSISASNIEIDNKKKWQLETGKYVKIIISDTGLGIDKSKFTKIFDPFYSTKEYGSGLGLASTYSIIKKHNGSITVDSELAVGTSFDILIPATGKKIDVLDKVEKKSKVKSTGKILLMDDDEMILKSSGKLIKKMGYLVDFARDGEETIALYKDSIVSGHPYDLLIMDLTIPGGMGGLETIQKLKKIDNGVKAIVSSGYSNDPVMAEFKQHGFCNVVIKPYKMDTLSQVIENVIFM